MASGLRTAEGLHNTTTQRGGSPGLDLHGQRLWVHRGIAVNSRGPTGSAASKIPAALHAAPESDFGCCWPSRYTAITNLDWNARLGDDALPHGAGHRRQHRRRLWWQRIRKDTERMKQLQRYAVSALAIWFLVGAGGLSATCSPGWQEPCHSSMPPGSGSSSAHPDGLTRDADEYFAKPNASA